jgi:hypothetical protein
LTKTSTVIPKGIFRGQVATLYSLRQVIGAYGGFQQKLNLVAGELLGLGSA